MAVKSTTIACQLVILCQIKLLRSCEKLRTLGFWVSTSRLTKAIIRGASVEMTDAVLNLKRRRHIGMQD